MITSSCPSLWRSLARTACLGLVASFVASPVAAQQAWPQRPITLIVSQSAGASPDVMARMLAERMAKTLGTGVVVENKPGGANVVGASAAARAAPDGHTLFFATSAALVSNPFMIKGLSYDPIKSFTPVALVARSHQILVVHPDVPAKTVAELVGLDKAQPGKLSIGVDSARNLAGITAQAFNKRAGTSMVLVPYPNINVAPQDVIAGRIQAGVFSVSVAAALVQAGQLRAIGIASEKRSTGLPSVPTIAETLPGFDFSGWFMIMAPAGTPPEVVARLNEAVGQAAQDPAVRELAPKLGFELESGSPAAAAGFLKEQLALWERITKELGLEAL